jgi:hypothetical protein
MGESLGDSTGEVIAGDDFWSHLARTSWHIII